MIPESTMDAWQALWCFYQDSALKTIATLASVGMIGTIAPVLMDIGPVVKAPLGSAHTPYIQYNRRRRLVQVWGSIALLGSILTLALYTWTYFSVRSEKCSSPDVSEACGLIVALYTATMSALVFYFFFVYNWRHLRRQKDELSAR